MRRWCSAAHHREENPYSPSRYRCNTDPQRAWLDRNAAKKTHLVDSSWKCSSTQETRFCTSRRQYGHWLEMGFDSSKLISGLLRPSCFTFRMLHDRAHCFWAQDSTRSVKTRGLQLHQRQVLAAVRRFSRHPFPALLSTKVSARPRGRDGVTRRN